MAMKNICGVCMHESFKFTYKHVHQIICACCMAAMHGIIHLRLLIELLILILSYIIVKVWHLIRMHVDYIYTLNLTLEISSVMDLILSFRIHPSCTIVVENVGVGLKK